MSDGRTILYVPPKKTPPTDYPRAQIAQMAESAIARHGGPAHATVYFKFTCRACGERCTFTEPNALYEEGECHVCGLHQPVTTAGFALHLFAA